MVLLLTTERLLFWLQSISIFDGDSFDRGISSASAIVETTAAVHSQDPIPAEGTETTMTLTLTEPAPTMTTTTTTLTSPLSHAYFNQQQQSQPSNNRPSAMIASAMKMRQKAAVAALGSITTTTSSQGAYGQDKKAMMTMPVTGNKSQSSYLHQQQQLLLPPPLLSTPFHLNLDIGDVTRAWQLLCRCSLIPVPTSPSSASGAAGEDMTDADAAAVLTSEDDRAGGNGERLRACQRYREKRLQRQRLGGRLSVGTRYEVRKRMVSERRE